MFTDTSLAQTLSLLLALRYASRQFIRQFPHDKGLVMVETQRLVVIDRKIAQVTKQLRKGHLS